MDARNTAQRTVAILVIAVGAWGSAACLGSFHIYTGDFNLRIPADPNNTNTTRGWMATAIIEVPDHLSISDLDIGISLTHTNVFDLQLFLQRPAGATICLNMFDFKKEFSVYPNYTNTIFDDEALLAIKDGVPPFTGRFRPLEPYKLSKFDGQDTYGSWLLQIYDAFYYDTGTFNHFELMITAPEPATAVILIFGAGLVSLFKPCRGH